MGIAAKKSKTECCFIKATDIQMRITAITIELLTHRCASFFFSHTEAIPNEYPTWRDGHTPVLVSMVYRS